MVSVRLVTPDEHSRQVSPRQHDLRRSAVKHAADGVVSSEGIRTIVRCQALKIRKVEAAGTRRRAFLLVEGNDGAPLVRTVHGVPG